MSLTKEEIKKFMLEDLANKKKQLAKVGERYYDGEHDIKNYKLYYYNADGVLVEDKTRANEKIPHQFFTELVDQKTQYMLSGKNGFIFSDLPELQNELDTYFNENERFQAELYDVVTGASTKGFEYMYAYMSKDGHTSFEWANSLTVIEVRAKDTDDKCDYIIYWYIDRIEKGTKLIKRIQVWDKSQTYFYVQENDGKIEIDKSVPLNPRPHVIYKTSDDQSTTYYDDYGVIPFFRLDNNRKQVSDLKAVKPLIDDYDIHASSLSNNLLDFDTPLYVVRGFQGDDLDELIKNVKAKKQIGVDENGGVDIKTVDIPYAARKEKLELDEKNIYRFGMGFNSAQLGDGNITNIVIKSRYALLDMKCNKLEIKLKQFLRDILDLVLAEINKNNGTDYKQKDVYFKFDREVITNEQDNATIEKTDAEKKQIEINTILGLKGTIDDETIIQTICEILDIDYEEIKSRLPKNPEDEIDEVATVLGGGSVE